LGGKGVVLYVLRKRPMGGYEMLKELSRPAAGRFIPSPGTLYPLLAYLEPEGLITAREIYVGRRRKKIYELTPQGEEQLDRLMEVEEFRGLVQMLESGAAAGDLLAVIRDELVYIDEVFDEVEGKDEALLEEVLMLLRRLEEKVSARLAQLRGAR
jgi:DNA-binding PadR family transcriptional regulator